MTNYYLSDLAFCSLIPNYVDCATQIHDVVGSACSSCNMDYYLSSLDTCTSIPDVAFCAVQVHDTVGIACAECIATYYRLDEEICEPYSTIDCADGS